MRYSQVGCCSSPLAYCLPLPGETVGDWVVSGTTPTCLGERARIDVCVEEGRTMGCPHCESGDTEERRERTALGCRHFRCRACQREFNARTGTSFNISEEKCLKRALAPHNFTNWRTRLQRFARKTLCFPRSRVMHDLLIGLYMNQVEFGRYKRELIPNWNTTLMAIINAYYQLCD